MWSKLQNYGFALPDFSGVQIACLCVRHWAKLKCFGSHEKSCIAWHWRTCGAAVSCAWGCLWLACQIRHIRHSTCVQALWSFWLSLVSRAWSKTSYCYKQQTEEICSYMAWHIGHPVRAFFAWQWSPYPHDVHDGSLIHRLWSLILLVRNIHCTLLGPSLAAEAPDSCLLQGNILCQHADRLHNDDSRNTAGLVLVNSDHS